MADSSYPGGKHSSDIPISLGKPSLRRRLEAYYSLINPDTIKDDQKWREAFHQIYEKYGGTHEGEKKLAGKLAKKYGNTVRLLLAESADKAQHNKDSNASVVIKTQREEVSFDLRPQEKNSGVIDFSSDQFDPEAAIRLPQEKILQVNPWITDCPVLNFLDQARSFLPTNDPHYRQPRSQNKPPSSLESQQRQTPNLVRKLGPFAAIAEHNKKGPMALLHSLLEKRQRVRVLIRYVNGIRGTLTGYLLAYDKHFNMILRDVDEVYCPRLPQSLTTAITTTATSTKSTSSSTTDLTNGPLEEQGTTEVQHNNDDTPLTNLEAELYRRTKALTQTTSRNNLSYHHQNESSSRAKITTPPIRWQVRQRHLKQLLVRGDNVVMIYRAESERSTWPQTSKSPTKSVHGRKAVVVAPEDRVGTPGSLIYSLQQQQRKSRPSQNQRYDYRSSPS